jgi:hypothetical protein
MDGLHLGVPDKPVIPPAKVMAGLQPERAVVVDDGESVLVDLPVLVDGSKDAL